MAAAQILPPTYTPVRRLHYFLPNLAFASLCISEFMEVDLYFGKTSCVATCLRTLLILKDDLLGRVCTAGGSLVSEESDFLELGLRFSESMNAGFDLM